MPVGTNFNWVIKDFNNNCSEMIDEGVMEDYRTSERSYDFTENCFNIISYEVV